jgi:hypothetical protein
MNELLSSIINVLILLLLLLLFRQFISKNKDKYITMKPVFLLVIALTMTQMAMAQFGMPGFPGGFGGFGGLTGFGFPLPPGSLGNLYKLNSF